MTPEEHARLAGKHRVSPEAYEAYLKGRFFWNKTTASGLRKSIEYFQQAISKEPRYALAYAALADSYEMLGPDDLPRHCQVEAKSGRLREMTAWV